MSGLIAFLDASVLYSAPLRDFLMNLALADLFSAKWSEMVHEEWIEAVLRNRPDLTRAQMERTRRLMNSHIDDALVEDFEHLMDGLSLPDPDDRHVLAAAIKSNSSIIVTNNLKDFPSSVLSTFKIEVLSPDMFVLQLMEISMQDVIFAASEQRRSLRNPPKSVEDYFVTLEKQGLGRTVTRLREFEHLI